MRVHREERNDAHGRPMYRNYRISPRPAGRGTSFLSFLYVRPAVCIKNFEFVHGRPCTCLQTFIHTAGRVYNTSPLKSHTVATATQNMTPESHISRLTVDVIGNTKQNTRHRNRLMKIPSSQHGSMTGLQHDEKRCKHKHKKPGIIMMVYSD